MKEKVRYAGAVAVALVALGGVWWAVSRPSAEAGDAGATDEATSRLAQISETTAAPTSPRGCATKKPETAGAEADGEEELAVDAWVEDLPQEWQALGQRLVVAIDKEDLPALKSLLPEALSCPNADVRQKMVEGLSWHDQDAVVELTQFLMDKDKDVADSAFSAWDAAVDQVEDEFFRIEASASVMMVLTDADNLSLAASKLEAADDRKAALLALVAVAESGNKAALDAVRESYEFIAGEEWTDVAAARAKAAECELEDRENQ